MSLLRTASTTFCSPSSSSMSLGWLSLRKKRSSTIVLIISKLMTNYSVLASKSKWWWSVLVSLTCPISTNSSAWPIGPGIPTRTTHVAIRDGYDTWTRWTTLWSTWYCCAACACGSPRRPQRRRSPRAGRTSSGRSCRHKRPSRRSPRRTPGRATFGTASASSWSPSRTTLLILRSLRTWLWDIHCYF